MCDIIVIRSWMNYLVIAIWNPAHLWNNPNYRTISLSEAFYFRWLLQLSWYMECVGWQLQLFGVWLFWSRDSYSLVWAWTICLFNVYFFLFLPYLTLTLSHLVTVFIFNILVRYPNIVEVFINKFVLVGIGIVLPFFSMACFFACIISRKYIRFTVILINESSRWAQLLLRPSNDILLLGNSYKFLCLLHFTVSSLQCGLPSPLWAFRFRSKSLWIYAYAWFFIVRGIWGQ